MRRWRTSESNQHWGHVNTKRLIGTAGLALALTACAPSPSPSPSPSTLVPSPSASAVAQRHVCGELRGEPCEAAIALVIERVPAMANSPLAVADVEEAGATTHRGGDSVVLVSFQPAGDDDLWWNPPTWIVTQGMLSDQVQIEPWREGQFPEHHVELLRSAGLDG